jgi:hypothetical protein
MSYNRIFYRRISAVNYLEYFLVSAISAVLIIRLFLELSGYPQIGGDTLHIAHMLWGGLLMLISIFLLLSFMGRIIENLSAIIGGIGFGTFIDEIGKFITQDNDYFYQPSVALIYLIFVFIFLIIRAIHHKSHYSSQEYLLNALRELEDLALGELDVEKRRRILEYLNQSGYRKPLLESIKKVLAESEDLTSPSLNIYQRTKIYIQSAYQKVADSAVFKYIVITFFMVQFITQLGYVLILIFLWGLGWDQIFNIQIVQNLSLKFDNLSFIEITEISSAFFSGIFTFLGIWYIPKSRIKAFQMFERSILISIFFTQVFVFYKEQFGALVGLTMNLFILFSLQFMIRREVNQEQNYLDAGTKKFQ